MMSDENTDWPELVVKATADAIAREVDRQVLADLNSPEAERDYQKYLVAMRTRRARRFGAVSWLLEEEG